MLKVTVESTHVETRSGVSKRNGKPYEMHSQAAWVYLVDPTGVPDKFPTKARFMVDSVDKAYAPGDYVLHPSAFVVNQWGDLELSFPKLYPARKPVQAAA